MMKILYLYPGASSPVNHYEKNLIEVINKQGKYKIDYWDWTTELRLNFNPSLRWSYKNRNILKSFYKQLERLTAKFDVLFIAQTGGLTPEYLEKLSIIRVFNTADDPDSSNKCSFPYLKIVDLVVHAGLSYYNDIPLDQEFYKRGAKKCYFMPIGFYEEMIPEIDFDKTFKLRDIQLVFAGRPRIQRLDLLKIFRSFNNIRVHSRNTPLYQSLYWKTVAGINITPYNGVISELYYKSKIGINKHLSYGPSNVRTYQLCAAGVAQVIDCKKNITKLYTDGVDILSYETANQAIDHIDNLSKDEELRYYISSNGYVKCREKYNRRTLMLKLFEYIGTI